MNMTSVAINGPVALTVVDKGFAPAATTKKYAGTSPDNVSGKPGRVYHLAI